MDGNEKGETESKNTYVHKDITTWNTSYRMGISPLLLCNKTPSNIFTPGKNIDTKDCTINESSKVKWLVLLLFIFFTIHSLFCTIVTLETL